MIHIELERFTRSKYEQLNPVLGFISLYPELIGSIEGFAIEEGEFLAPHVRRLITVGEGGIEEFACQIATQSIGSIQFDPTRANTEIDVLRRFAKQLLRQSASTSFYGHHLCHAANALFSSNFTEALSITLDGGGVEVIAGKKTSVHGSVWRLSRNEREVPAPILLESAQSIGLGWHRIRDIFGLREGEEGTVMAMAAFGKPCTEMDALVANELLWVPMSSELPKPLARSLGRFLKSVAAAINSDEDKFSLAMALQRETEVRARRFLTPYLENFRGNLCLSGGVFLNCQLAGKIKSWFPGVREVYIPPAPYDGGISIGAAQMFAHCSSAVYMTPVDAPPAEFAPFAIGRTYSRIETIGAIRAHGCDLRAADPDKIARMLNDGAVLGLFQGAAESGRRALGHRSIIADPRNPEMKERINSLIKHRQWFRPFAPMVLAEQVADWFQIEPGFASPYMSFAVPVRPDKRALIPAVVHHDGTARLQTVHPNLTPLTHRLLQSWQQYSGIPVLLNTSFNDREPIVQHPSEALATFLRIPLDGVYFADFEILAVRHTQPTGNATNCQRDEKITPVRSVGRLINRLRRRNPHSSN
jgi:carbamoyltransferase